MKLRKLLDKLHWFYEGEAYDPRPLDESRLSRVWKWVEDNRSSFGIVSAYTSQVEGETDLVFKKRNVAKHEELRRDIRNMGYGYTELMGGYKYKGDDDYTLERSFLISGITKKQIIDVGRKYNQESVIYKDDKEFSRLNQYGFAEASYVKAAGIHNIDLAKEAVKEYFSSLLKGSHRGKKFAFQELKLLEFKLLETDGIQNYLHAMGMKNTTTPLIWWRIVEEKV